MLSTREWGVTALTIALAACDGGSGVPVTPMPDVAPDGCTAPPLPDAGPRTGPAPVDAPAATCWPIETATPRGRIQLGTGYDDFRPMTDELELVWGTQGGFHLEVHARISGLNPGGAVNVLDTLDASNPRTMFRAFWVDTGESINDNSCGIRIGYTPSCTAVDLAKSSAILYEVGLPTSQIFDRQVRIVVEIIDSEGGYAIDEKLVMPRAPQGWPGCCI